MTSKVSIIVPIYNTAWNLKKCILSLCSQTYKNIEIILINDGSTDNSLEICKQYADRDPRIIIINKENSGVSDSRNVGIKVASGEYITFVDSDDWVNETYIEDFEIDNIINNDNILISQGIIYDFNSSLKNLIMFQYPNISLNIHEDTDKLKNIGVLGNGCPVAKIFSRKTILNNNIFFDTKISLNEDHLFVLDYLYYTDLIFFKQSINYHYFFNYKTESLTKKYHSSNEYLYSAYKLNHSFNKLCSKLKLQKNFWENEYSIFGPMQLIRASYISFKEGKSKYILRKVLDIWRELNIETTFVKLESKYGKVFSKYINKNFNVLYVLLYLTYCESVFIKKIKYLIKKYIMKY